MPRRLALLLALFLAAGPLQAAPPQPLKVHLIGIGEYEAAKSMAAFKDHLEKHFHVACTTSLKSAKDLENLDKLKEADVMIVFARRMKLPEEQMALIRAHWEKGKPIVAMRTASHAFQPADNALFDGKVLGGAYRGSGSYSKPFDALVVPEQKKHPVLDGVGKITSKGYYGNGKLAEDALVLQVVDSTRKTPQPVTWLHTYKGGRTFYTSMGVPEDFRNETFRKLLANAVFWTARREMSQYRK